MARICNLREFRHFEITTEMAGHQSFDGWPLEGAGKAYEREQVVQKRRERGEGGYCRIGEIGGEISEENLRR